MQKLVNDIGAGQAPGVEDRRLAALVVGDNADQAVADPAELVADGEGGNPLQLDPVCDQAEARLPAGEKGVMTKVDKSDNESQSSLRVGRAASKWSGTVYSCSTRSEAQGSVEWRRRRACPSQALAISSIAQQRSRFVRARSRCSTPASSVTHRSYPAIQASGSGAAAMIVHSLMTEI
jgi:hypothetical protein